MGPRSMYCQVVTESGCSTVQGVDGGSHHLTALTVTAQEQEQEQGRCSLLGGSD